jgi:hypothetical protein
MFKRLFGKPEDELSGLNVNRWVKEPDIQLPSRKPPPNVQDLVLPETLAEEAKRARDVDVSFAISSGGSPGASGTEAAGRVELTDDQIEAIAARVAEKLTAGVLGDQLRQSVTRIVSETSERLVREEIARIRAGAGGE